jgi:hypothetical protein
MNIEEELEILRNKYPNYYIYIRPKKKVIERSLRYYNNNKKKCLEYSTKYGRTKYYCSFCMKNIKYADLNYHLKTFEHKRSIRNSDAFNSGL